MIAISTTIYSTLPTVIIRDNGKHTFGDVTRRVTRTATLDGASVFDDKGSTITDRQITMDLTEITAAEAETLTSMVASYATLVVNCPAGDYLCRPTALTLKTLTLYITAAI